MSDVTLILQAVARGESRASADLLPLVYDELRRLASSRMASEGAGQTLQATALVHEAWLKLVSGSERTWENRSHFFRAAAQAMRRILVDRAREKATLKRGAGAEKVPIHDLEISAVSQDEKLLLVNEALQRLETEDPECARVVTLKFFGGLTNEEVAKSLDMSKRSVDRQWAYAKAYLVGIIQKEL